MAGNWIKFEVDTPEKPEVLALTVAMGWDDPDLTVGKLLRVWRWFDQQTLEGNAPGVSAALLDRIAGVSGFANAMARVGWLIVSEDGISLPNFDRHNGETAKSRALTAKRVAKHKAASLGNGDGNGESVTAPLPREEKNREEKNKTNVDGSSKAEARASRLPDNWEATDEQLSFCRKERPDLDAFIVASRFRDYWVAIAGAKGRKLDWDATWRNWVRNEKSVQARASPGSYAQHRDQQRDETIAILTGRKPNERTTDAIDVEARPID